MDGNALTSQDIAIRRHAVLAGLALSADDLMADYRRLARAEDHAQVEHKAKILTQLCRAVQAVEAFISRFGETEMNETDAPQTGEENGSDPCATLEFKAAEVKRKLTHMARILRPEFYPELGGCVPEERPGGIRGSDG